MKNISLLERVPNEAEAYRVLMDKIAFYTRVAMPAIVKSFDAEKQTITAQICVKERVYINGEVITMKIGLLVDVPIYMPRAGNFVLTMPVKEGDECLVIFADQCIDSWWEKGGEDNEPMDVRRHDLSDGFALLGVWSQPEKLKDYSEDSAQLRTLDGKSTIELADDGINVTTDQPVTVESSDTVTIKSDDIKLGASSGLRKLIDERLVELFNQHTHPYINVTTPSTTNPPTTPLVLETLSTEKTKAL